MPRSGTVLFRSDDGQNCVYGFTQFAIGVRNLVVEFGNASHLLSGGAEAYLQLLGVFCSAAA